MTKTGDVSTSRGAATTGLQRTVTRRSIGGGADHTVPAAVDRSMARKYAKGTAVTEYKEFARRSHFTIGEPGWEQVADFALEWAVDHASPGVPA